MIWEFESLIARIQSISDFGMLAIIWVVQLYTYPRFLLIDQQRFIRWHQLYIRRIACFVIPLMIGQAIAGITAVYLQPSLGSGLYLGLVTLTWCLTLLVAAPLHRKLQDVGNDPDTIRRLVEWNWGRSIAWTAIVFV
jgi:hypothetical protein